MLWPDITQFGRITSDVVRGMSVTQSVTVGHIARESAYPNGILLLVVRRKFYQDGHIANIASLMDT